MRKQHFIASVQNDHLDRIEEVARKLRSKGCNITQILSITGVIAGSVNVDTDLEDLRVEGVASIEKQRTYQKKK